MRRLNQWFKSQESVLVAFSGGVDSSLLAKIAYLSLGDKSLAVSGESPSLPQSELKETKRIAAEIGINHLIVKTNEINDKRYSSNPSNRCYYCKSELFTKLQNIAKTKGYNTIVDGTNVDDIKEDRPGRLAGKENNVKSPFVELNLTKEDIRILSRELKMSTSEKPSSPCLSSRIATGIEVTEERLKRIEQSEIVIRNIVGAKILRVRDHGDTARIEIGRDERKLFFNEEILDKIDSELKKTGYRFVSFELSGYSSGNLSQNNKLLQIKV